MAASAWRTHLIIPCLIVASGCAPLVFRCFISLEGPMHVLHACVVKASWFSDRYHTVHADYLINRGTLDLSDLLLIPLTWLLPPVQAHAAYGACVLLVLSLGAWWVARGLGAGRRPLLLWLLPLTFSYVFLLGFFTFLFAAGCALMVTAWWIGRPRIRWRTLFLAALLVLACQAVHRAGATLAILFITCHEAMLFFRARDAWRLRWAAIARPWRWAGSIAAVMIATWKVVNVVRAAPFVRLGHEQDRWQEIFTGRPLLLFAHQQERAMLITIGGLFLLTLIVALVQRFKQRDRPHAVDGMGLAALALLLASVVLHTGNAQFLYLATRAQTIALLPLTIWMAALFPSGRSAILLAVVVVGVHGWRMVYSERVMADARMSCEQAMEVVPRLPLHGVTLPVVRDDNWLLEHISAFPAAAYQGIFLSPSDHLGFVHRPGEHWQLRDYYDGYQHELSWLDAHVGAGTPPLIDHVVVFGRGRAMDERWRNLQIALARRYFLQWKNAYAEVWVLRDG